MDDDRDSYPVKGYIQVPQGMIALIEVHEGDTREMVYQPDEDDIERICREHNFDLDKTMKLIQNRTPDVHCIIFLAEVYRNAEE